MKVMIVVTHLLGTGHLSRALTLGRAYARDGSEVLVVSGGMPAPQLNRAGLTLFGLPPLRSDGTDFTRLLTETGSVADDTYLSARIVALTQAVQRFQPDVLITELFPFGRRSLAREFTAALEAAHGLPRHPLILGSIRDILAPPSKPEKAHSALAMVMRYYDGILVHSDPKFTKLDVSWPVTAELSERLHYTGFVAPPAPQPHTDGVGRDEVIVSAGGGSVGQPIFRSAIEAARKMPDRRWRLLVGGRDASARIADLSKQAKGTNITLEPVRPDFREMLPIAAASVSMCGYNTALDILQSGTPAVFIPFDDGNEVEQGLRAQSLADLPGIGVLPSARLSGTALAKAVGTVLSDGARVVPTQGFDGARKAVEITKTLLERRG
nr:glycosyltransferase [uncultured Ruegeria sp.]